MLQYLCIANIIILLNGNTVIIHYHYNILCINYQFEEYKKIFFYSGK